MDAHDEANGGDVRGGSLAAAGGRIAAARRAAGLSQQALARTVGVSRSAVAQWETGRAGQLGGHLARLSAALGVPVAVLLGAEAPGRVEGRVADATELALLRLYRALAPADRALVLRTLRRLAGRGEPGS